MVTITTDKNGTRCQLLNGQYHREDGPAFERVNGDQIWYLHGKKHRRFGAAVITAARKEYWLNGKRYDMPKFNSKPKCWWLNGTKYELKWHTPFVYAMVRALYFVYYTFACLTFRTCKPDLKPIFVNNVDPIERDRHCAVVRYDLSKETMDKLANGYWERKRNRKV